MGKPLGRAVMQLLSVLFLQLLSSFCRSVRFKTYVMDHMLFPQTFSGTYKEFEKKELLNWMLYVVDIEGV